MLVHLEPFAKTTGKTADFMLAKLSDEQQYWAGLEASASAPLLSHAVLAIQKLESATSL
jgi:hypothetical protein